MSVIAEPQPKTVQQRVVDATASLRQTLKLDDLKLLNAAIAEVAASEVKRNSIFAESIRRAYQELEKQPTKPPRPSRTSPIVLKKLVPIARVEGYETNPFAPPDPEYLLKVYGASQLRDALEDHTLVKLKEAAEIQMQKHPGTKPKTKSKKADVIDYIVEIVTGKK